MVTYDYGNIQQSVHFFGRFFLYQQFSILSLQSYRRDIINLISILYE